MENCGSGQGADFWFIAKYVNLNTTLTQVIHVQIEAGHNLCYDAGTNTYQECYLDYFEVYIYPGKYELDIKNVP